MRDAMLSLMEQFYDMHCHLGFAPEPAAAAAVAASACIGGLSCTVEPAEYERLQDILANECDIALGLGAHPWWIADGRVGDAELERFCALAPSAPYIGEIGLDFASSRDTEESRALQTAAFSRILAACNEELPTTSAPHENLDSCAQQMASVSKTDGKLISVHAVNAAGVALDLLEQAGTLARHHVVFHWFSGTSDDLARAVRGGCYFSVGPRMLASRRGREYARQIPLDHLLLETDMPSREGDALTAEVWRAELGNALAGIAQLKQLSREDVLSAIDQTSARLLAV